MSLWPLAWLLTGSWELEKQIESFDSVSLVLIASQLSYRSHDCCDIGGLDNSMNGSHIISLPKSFLCQTWFNTDLG